jgi:hypothetical protein
MSRGGWRLKLRRHFIVACKFFGLDYRTKSRLSDQGWAIVTGIFRSRWQPARVKEDQREWLLVLSGTSIIFGICG